MWTSGTVLGGRYALTDPLVDAGTSEVWWADDTLLGRPVVVRILHPVPGGTTTAAARFRDEASAVAEFVPLGAADGDARTPYVVVQFVDGRPPGAWPAATGPVPSEQIPEAIAEALEAMRTPPEPRGATALHGPVRRRRRRRAVAAALPAAAAVAATTLFVMYPSAGTGGADSLDSYGSSAVAQAPFVPAPAPPTETQPPAETGPPPSAAPVAPPPPSPVPSSNSPSTTGSSAPPRTSTPPRPTPTARPSSRTPARTTPVVSSPPPARPVAKPAAAVAPPPVPVVPAGCGGPGWGPVTNVGDGLRIGIDTATPGVGAKLVMGGHAEYGWVVTAAGPWQNIQSCNGTGPVVVTESFLGGPASLGTAKFTNGLLTVAPAATPGAFVITQFAGFQCLTDHGPAAELTFTACVAGDKAQEWYIP